MKSKKTIAGGIEPAAKAAISRARLGLTTRVQRVNGVWVYLTSEVKKSGQ